MPHLLLNSRHRAVRRSYRPSMSAESPHPHPPRRLGRGLEALLSAKPADRAEAADRNAFQRIPISQIQPNQFQPRQDFDPVELQELELSIQTNGLLQPIAVRTSPTGRGYEVIAGERRLRAATRLGWTDIPAIVKTVDDRTLLTLALVENLQRADLNPIEEAEGYQRLINEFSLTQQQVAELVGKDRSTIANTLRLIQLPASVRRMLQDGQLTLGHARALLALGDTDQIVAVAREIVARGLTVRDVERRARDALSTARKPRRTPDDTRVTAHAEVRRIEDNLRRRLQTDVRVSATASNRGTIEIAFYSLDDLDRVLEIILGPGRER